MEFRILGPLEVFAGTRRVRLPAGRGRALLALLILNAGEAVAAERLIDELWGERPPPTAPTVVQGLVSKLRTTLDPARAKGDTSGVLQTIRNSYRLVTERDAVDANRFRRLVDEARSAALEVRSELLRDALDLWRGPALADFAYEPFAQRAITALEDLRIAATEDRVSVDIELGRASGVVGELERLVAEHPFRERLHELLMLALYRAGRQADALDAYRRARTVLVEELGIEPGPSLRDLESAILNQDPSLASPLRSPAADEERWLPRERRTVTVVAADLSPVAEPNADAEAVVRIGARMTEAATDVFARHGARVENVFGDLLMAFFGFPVAHEDDAVRAVRAALEVRSVVDELNDGERPAGVRYAVRVGTDTGDIVVEGPGMALRDLRAAPVVIAAGRLQHAAADRELLVGPATQKLVRGAIVLEPAGEGSWRALELVAGTWGVEAPPGGPMFGRQAELSVLRTTFHRVTRSATRSLMCVVGEAGIGKSRLVREFLSTAGNVRVITGRAPAYGEGITLLPLREALDTEEWRAFATDEDRTQIHAAIGLGEGSGDVATLPKAVARVFSSLAADRPLIAVFEDLHWAGPTFLDLLEQVTLECDGPVFMLCVARPELIERRPGWASYETMTLAPLAPQDIEDLVAGRIESLDAETRRRVVETARGNPLFAEQLLAAIEDEAFEAVPPSLQSLLATRLDRLGPGERDLVRCASIVGLECPRTALEALLPGGARAFVDRHAERLERKQLITRTAGGGLRFGHVLIQLAAYQSMTRSDRARLHETFGRWLETAPERPPELNEMVGFHLEQAVVHRHATGAPVATDLASRAIEHLRVAGDRALARMDQSAAQNLMSRARALLSAGDVRWRRLSQQLAEIDLVLGRFDDAQEMLRDVVTSAADDGDVLSERAARLEHARIQFIRGPDPVPLAEIEQEARDAVAFYEHAGDEAAGARALFLAGCVLLRRGEMTAAERAFRDGLAAADRSGTVREKMATRWMIGMVAGTGPAPVTECIAACTELSASLGGPHPGLMLETAGLLAMEGRFDEAYALNERARVIFAEDMHAPRLLLFSAAAHATIAMLAGDTPRAERALRVRLEHALATQERENIAQTAAHLSSVLAILCRTDDALEFASLAERTAPADGAVSRALATAAVARSASVAGDHDRARELASAAAAQVPREMLNLHGDVLLALASVLRAAGDETAAKEIEAQASGLYRQKGNVVSAERLVPTLSAPY